MDKKILVFVLIGLFSISLVSAHWYDPFHWFHEKGSIVYNGITLETETSTYQVFNRNYTIKSKSGNESLYDVTFNKTQVSIGFITYLNETSGKNVTIEQFREDTIICLEAGWDSKDVITYKFDEKTEKKIVDKNYTYSVPSSLSFYKNTTLVKQVNINKIKISYLSITSVSNPNKFCYQANPEKDFYLKFGDNSVIVIQDFDWITTSLLTNVTAESGDANFTHLNISNTVPYDSLVGYWNFDGDNVNSKLNISYDFSKENNDGTMVGDAVVNSTGCIYGDCLQLDEVGDYVDFGTSTTGLNFGNFTDFTISVWVKPLEIDTGVYTIYSKSESASCSPSPNYPGFALFHVDRYGMDGTIKARIKDRSGTAVDIYSYGVDYLVVSQWTHVVFVANRTGNGQIYMDGVAIGSGIAISTVGNISVPNCPAVIGRASDWDGNHFNGSIDEVMIFNTSLTADQILEIYNNQSARFLETGTQKVRAVNITNTTTWNGGGYDRVNLITTFERNMDSNISARIGQFNISVDPDGLVLYMPFEWGSAVDISGQGNDGTIINDTYFNETGGLNDTGGFEFDGDGDYVDVGNDASLDFGSSMNFTLSAWVKSTNTVTNQVIYAKRNSGPPYNGFSLKIANNDIRIYLDDGPTALDFYSLNELSSNTWAHVAFVANITYGTLYVNGVDVNRGADISSIDNVSSSANARISDFIISDFNGTIDEVMIFSRSLSAAEISALYGNQSVKYNVAYYTDYQNITTDTNETFTISTEADFIFPDYKQTAGNTTTSFYSPIIFNDISLETFSSEVEEDTTSPTWSLNQTNSTIVNRSTLFSIYWNDNIALHPTGQYIFSTNNTGVWVNESAVNFTATPEWANVTLILNDTVGTWVGYRWYVDDNAGNENVTDVFSLITTSAVVDSCNPDSLLTGDHTFDCEDNCVQTSNLDAGGFNINILGTGTFTLLANITNYIQRLFEGTDSNNICIIKGIGGWFQS